MRFLEELQMNALPALQTYLYDGWVLRFADGCTNRANSVNPIYEGREDVNEKIKYCEKLYEARGLKPVYKITPSVFPETLDAMLEKRGYDIVHPTSVQTLSLGGNTARASGSTLMQKQLIDEWFLNFCTFNAISKEKIGVYRKFFENLIPDAFYFSYLLDGETVACGMAVLEKGYFGLFDISTKEECRNKGYGARMLSDILNYGKVQGAETAYLQVMLNNAPALHLYDKMGFKEAYRYHYRVLQE